MEDCSSDVTKPHGVVSGPVFLAKLEQKLSWRVLLILWAILLQLLLLIYAPSLRTPFLYDDFANIVSNEDLRSKQPVNAILADHPSSVQFDRRPVGGLITLFNFKTSGLDVKAFRVTNIAIHWLCAGLLGLVALEAGRRIKNGAGSRIFAVTLALLWALHPIQSTAVIYISQRMESLMTLFFLLSCAFLLKSASSKTPGVWRAGAAMAAMLCLLSKENGAGLILFLAVMDRLLVVGSWRRMWESHRVFYSILGSCWVLASIWILQGPRVGEWDDVASLASPWRYFQTECIVVTDYLRMTLWPDNQVFAPVPRTTETLYDWLPWCALLVVLFGALAQMAFRLPWLWLPWLVILLVLAPTSSFVPVPLEPAFDYRMHLPSAGVLSLVLAGGWYLAQRLRLRSGWIVTAVGACVVSLGVVTRFRAETYARPETIWLDTVAKEPLNVRAWFNLSAVFMALGRKEECLAAAERARDINQSFQLPWIDAQYFRMLGLLEEMKEQWAEAEGHFRQAVISQPDYPASRIDLARILIRSNRPADVLEILSFSAVQPPVSPEWDIWKTIALVRMGRLEEALKSAAFVQSAQALLPRHEEARRMMNRELAGEKSK